MPQLQQAIEVRTDGAGAHEITAEVARVVAASGVRTGLAVVFCRHTSASLLVHENAAPSALRDLLRWLERMAPEGAGYEHDAEGPDDMPAHLRAALTRTSETVPVADGRLALGTWQGIFLLEHRRRGHRRELLVHVSGE